MSSAQAILMGAFLIAGTLLFVHSITPAEAQREGPYQLMHHSSTTALAGVFRLNVGTGEVSYCYMSDAAILNCTKPIY
jgi:hypothetical protein